MGRNIRTLFIIILIGISILSSSCVSNVGGSEINRIAIVTSIAVDYEDDKVIITCEVANPVSEGGSGESTENNPGSEAFIYPQGMGNTIREAIDDLNLHFDRKIFLSHSNMIIIGEDFAKRGITDLMDFFKRDNEPRENMYMVIAKGTKAYEIIGIRAGLGRAGGNYLFDILNNFPYNGRSKNITFTEKYRYFYDVSNEPVVGVVQFKEIRQLDMEKRNKEPTRKILDVSGGAALRRDYLLGYFTGEEMLGFNFIVGEIKGGAIVFHTPVNPDANETIIGKDGKYTTVSILRSKTKKKIQVDKGKIHLIINVKLRGGLNEINQAIDIDKEETMSLIEKACSERVEEYISMALDKGQKEFKQDNFSIGVAVHRQHPGLWKEIGEAWNDIFPDISYEVNVDTTIVKLGLISTPANVRKRR